MTWRSAKLRLGAMRERIDIQQATLSVDTIGQSIPTWSNLLTSEPASFIETSGVETFQGKQVNDGTAAVFTIHYDSRITPMMQVVHATGTYGITFVRRVEGGTRYMELVCLS